MLGRCVIGREATIRCGEVNPEYTRRFHPETMRFALVTTWERTVL